MTTTDYATERKSGAAWLFAPIVVILFLGAALSIAAFFYSDPHLTIVESLAAGFGGLAGLMIGLFAAVIGVIIGLIGALIGIAAAGGALAMTLFIIGSPIIAIILLIIVMNRRKSCPDPSLHE